MLAIFFLVLGLVALNQTHFPPRGWSQMSSNDNRRASIFNPGTTCVSSAPLSGFQFNPNRLSKVLARPTLGYVSVSYSRLLPLFCLLGVEMSRPTSAHLGVWAAAGGWWRRPQRRRPTCRATTTEPDPPTEGCHMTVRTGRAGSSELCLPARQMETFQA